MAKNKSNHDRGIIKDGFRSVTTSKGAELTLCTDCLHELRAHESILLALIPDVYEEIECDVCHAINAIAALQDEIRVSGPPRKVKTWGGGIR